MPANKKPYFAEASARKRSLFMEVQNYEKGKKTLSCPFGCTHALQLR